MFGQESVGETIEQLVLPLLDVGDGGEDVRPVLGHRLGVRAGVAVLERGHRRFRDHRSHSLVVGVLRQVCELFVDHPQLLAQRAQPDAELVQLAFDQSSTHG